MDRTQKWMGSVGCLGQIENIKRQSLDNDNLYLKIIFCTSNTQAVIDEVKLYGYSK